MPQLSSVGSILWSIWKSRNDSVFRGKPPYVQETVESAKLLLANFRKWNTQKSKIEKESSFTIPLSWIPPEEKSLIFTVDGSFVEGSVDGAIAGICRDHSGNIVVGFAKSVKASSAAQVETLAVHEALQFIASSDDQSVCFCVESDRVDLINALISKSADQFNWEERLRFSDCLELISAYPHINLSHCPGESNLVADWAVKLQRLGRLPQNWLVAPPQALRDLLC